MMEQNFQTSFIPKKPIIEKRVGPSRPVSLLTMISIFILFAVLILTGGLYFYKNALTQSITQMGADLVLAQNRFEASKITELETLNKRLRAASDILANHVNVTPVFQALSALTMKTIRYTKFSYDLGTDKNAKVTIRMSGIAIGYRSVALQSDLFAKNKNITDPVFSNLTLDNSGNVLFDLQFSVDPSFINYKQTVAAKS